MRKLFVLALALALAAGIAGCGSDDTTTTAPSAAPPSTDTTASEPETPDLTGILKTAGVLTVGAEPPAPPFIIPPYPDNPTGFEVDIAKEIATRLGIPETKFIEFVWTNLFSPAPKPFDFDINETTITDERDEVVDFSDPYFEANQAILVHKGTDAENATTMADIQGLLLGAQDTTTGLSYINDTIKPSQEPRVFSTTAAANQALLNKSIDAFIIDLPIAAGLVGENPDDLVVVGQFVTNEEWGMVFEDGSELVPYVNEALAAMIADGTLAELQEKWLPGTSEVPVIQ
jgi:polar amino acid transport system substrate-binding protein